jgi:hypothetical protein
VDNQGDRDNYVLFEFDQMVVVDRAFLDSIGADSDITVWIGTAASPYTDHLNLSDDLLDGFQDEDNDVSNNSARWANINSGIETGNVLVISASVSDTTPDDEFKIKQLDVDCAPAPTPCVAGVFDTTGNSAGSGTAGNIRTFTTGSMNVKASGFSRNKSTGQWQTAFVGAFSTGLGVTDQSEGNGDNDRHKADNIDRDNYLLFEFDHTVVVDRAFLNSIGADSDVTVWIGNAGDPYNNHQSLSDGLLTSFGSEDNNGGSTSRWADINATSESGNMLVIGAAINSASDNDAFKVNMLDVKCSGPAATVTIIKEVLGLGGSTSSAQSFAFTATNFGTANFSLTDQNVTGPDRIVNNTVSNFGADHPITVTESPAGGWTLLSISCVETGGIQNSSALAFSTATLIVEAGENIVCTFRNGQSSPTAAPASVNGQVVFSDGLPISGAVLVLTNASTGATRMVRTSKRGQYTFEGLEVNEFYSLTVSHKFHVFAPDTQFFTLSDDMTGSNFIAVQ